MIRYIKRCMAECQLEEYKWDGHFAFLHFKNYQNIYLNGKHLKWHDRFKNGDIIEEIIQPEDPVTAFFLSVGGALGLSGTTAMVVGGILSVGAVAGIATSITLASTMGGFSGRASSGQAGQKEYDSSSQPELKGSNNSISDGIIPYIFGRTQQTANYGQQPYKLVADGASTNKFRQYFVANYNNVVFSEEKLGESLVSNYSVDYVNIVRSYGGDTFIGFDNVKAVNKDEELSYNADEQVSEAAVYTYNQATTSTSLQIDFELLFTNVDTSNWTDKEFTLQATIIDDTSTSVDLTEDFTIGSGDLVAVTGYDDRYTYSGTKTWTQDITELVETNFQPTADTRGNSTENTNELDCLYVEQDITTDDFSTTTELNQSINQYEGTTSEVIETSPPKTTEIDVLLSFPQGLYKQKNDGSRASRNAIIDVEYKEKGSSTWNPISEATSIYVRDLEGNKQDLSSSTTTVSGSKVTVKSPSNISNADQLFYRPIGMELPEGTYDVRVRSADFADKSNFDIGVPYLHEVHFYVNDDVLDVSILPKVNQIAFTATAYKGLSGTLKKFNYIAEAKIPIWNGSDWTTVDKTTNPAAIIRDLLTNPLVNPRAESVEDIDNDSLVELYNFCEERGYKASGVVSEPTKIDEIIGNILANCQSAMIPLLDGKHTFVIDRDDKTPIGLFNQHNSFNFKWTPRIGRQTEAIRASFVNNTDYTEDELTVYYYDGDVHEVLKSGTTDQDYEIVKKEYKYVNDRTSVLNIAKYELKAHQQKRNRFEFDVNLEGLNLRRFDRCYISNSTCMQNESSGLIKSVITSDGNLIGFKLCSEIEIPENAKIIIRSLDYDNEAPVVNVFDVNNTGLTDTVEITPIIYDGVIKGAGEITGIQDTWHYDGDLFTLGQDTIHDALIIDIKYNENNTATITARDY